MNELGSNGAFSGTLAADSSNVVTLVRDLYNVSKKEFHPSSRLVLRGQTLSMRVESGHVRLVLDASKFFIYMNVFMTSDYLGLKILYTIMYIRTAL